MTDLPNPIPEALIAEACRELNVEYDCWTPGHQTTPHPVVRTLCRKLWEFGWRPPVDPDLIEAREIVAKWYDTYRRPIVAKALRGGDRDHFSEVQLTLAGIKRGRELGSGV
jgi:hypothetical protein